MFAWLTRNRSAAGRLRFHHSGLPLELQRDDVSWVAAPETVMAVRRDLHTGWVATVRRLPGDVLSLVLDLEQPLIFSAGQYAHLALDEGARSRAYSFCHEPKAQGNRSVAFLIRCRDGGAFTGELWARAQPGTRMVLTGPFGSFGAAQTHSHAICVAEETGLAPLVSLVSDRLLKSDLARFAVLLGIRRSDEHFAREVLHGLEARSAGRVQTQVIVSDEPETSTWPGARGRVTDLITPELVTYIGAGAAYVCGGAPMVQACRDRLHRMGWHDGDIHAEVFAPSGPDRL